MKTIIATLSLVLLAAACSQKKDGSAVLDHVSTADVNKVVKTTPAEAPKASKLIDTLIAAGLKNTAAAGTTLELYNAEEFGVEIMAGDDQDNSFVTMYRSEGAWHRSPELLNDKAFDIGWTTNLAEGKLDGDRSYKCSYHANPNNPFAGPGYVLPLLSCTREAGKPETTICTINYRCIALD